MPNPDAQVRCINAAYRDAGLDKDETAYVECHGTGTKVGDWTVIGNYRVPDPPSGLPQGQTNSADQAFLNAGVDFNVSFDARPVKYIRIVVKDTWFGLDYTNIREISMYGAPQ